MANKSWLLLTTVLCLLTVNEFGIGSTAARPQRTKSRTQARLIRFQPITREQYDSILKLTSGEPLISEARLINNGYRSLSSIGNSISEDLNKRLRVLLNITKLFTSDSSSEGTKGYPLCVIKTGDSESDGHSRTTSNSRSESEEDNDEDSDHHSSYPPYPPHPAHPPRPSHPGSHPPQMYVYGGDDEDQHHHDNEEDGDNSQRPIVNCIVVVKQPTADDDDPACTHPHAPGCSCNPNTDPRCPGYCQRNPRDRENCPIIDHPVHHHQSNDDDHHRRRSSYSPYPYSYPPYGGYPYYMPHYDHRYAYTPHTGRAAPTQDLVEHVADPVATQVKKKDVTTKLAPRRRLHRKRVNKPAMAETKRNIARRNEEARAAYDYSQLYQQLYNGGQAQAPFGYNPYANYQLNPYAGVGFAGATSGASLRFPAQFQPQLQPQIYPQFGNFGNFAAQSDSGEDSSGEYSGEESGEENYDEGRTVNGKTDDSEKLENEEKPIATKST